MKTIIVFCLGFAAGLYFCDYRAARIVKKTAAQTVASIDRALR